MAEPQTQISDDDFLRLLRAVRDRQIDGYSLMSRTGWEQGKLASVLETLSARGLITVKGELRAGSIGDTLIAVPPDALGKVDLILSQFSPFGRGVR